MNLIIRLSLPLIISLLILSSCAKQGSSVDTANTDDLDNVEIARSMYTTLLAGDMAAAHALMVGNISWTYYGGEGQIPFSGVYTGHTGIEQFFADYSAVVTPLGMEIESYSASGDTVFVEGIEKGRINATGKEYAAPWVHVIKIKNKKIVSYEEYIDSALVAAAFE
jgi:ketosteroid isomerase-like protein